MVCFIFSGFVLSVTYSGEYTGQQTRFTIDSSFVIENSFFYSISQESAVFINDLGTGCKATIIDTTFSDLSAPSETALNFGSLVLFDFNRLCFYNCIATEGNGALFACDDLRFRRNENDYTHKLHFISATKCQSQGPLFAAQQNQDEITTQTECNFELKHCNFTNNQNDHNYTPGAYKIHSFLADIYQCTYANTSSPNAILYLVESKGPSYFTEVHECNFISNEEGGSAIIQTQSGYAMIYNVLFKGNIALQNNGMIHSTAKRLEVGLIYSDSDIWVRTNGESFTTSNRRESISNQNNFTYFATRGLCLTPIPYQNKSMHTPFWSNHLSKSRRFMKYTFKM